MSEGGKMINRVYNMDCMTWMKDKPDKYYDLAIVDPPYGIGFSGEKLSMTKGLRKDGTIRHDKSWRAKNYIQKYESKEWDKEKPKKIYWDELKRISKNQIIWGANYFADILGSSSGIIIWDKKATKEFSLSDGELAYASNSGKLRIFSFLWSGYRKGKKEFRIHPTQKPVDLYKWLLQNYAKPGQTIFDSHVGSGSIRIACHDLGFDFEGTELDPDYWQAQEKRYQDHIAQSELFDKGEIQDLVFGGKDETIQD